MVSSPEIHEKIGKYFVVSDYSKTEGELKNIKSP